MKQNFSPLQEGCGETKFSPLPAECGEKKIFTARIANLTNIHRANFNACLIFTGNIIALSDRWPSGLRKWWHAWGRGSNPCTAVFFVRIPVKAVKKNFSPQNSTQFLRKFSAFSAFNAKRCGRFAVKKVFFSPLFTANLTIVFDKTSTRGSNFYSIIEIGQCKFWHEQSTGHPEKWECLKTDSVLICSAINLGFCSVQLWSRTVRGGVDKMSVLHVQSWEFDMRRLQRESKLHGLICVLLKMQKNLINCFSLWF